MAGQDNKLSPDKKEKLDELGFDFTGTGAAGGDASAAVAAAPPAMPGMPPAAPAAPAVPTDPTQMTFEQQMAAMQAMSF